MTSRRKESFWALMPRPSSWLAWHHPRPLLLWRNEACYPFLPIGLGVPAYRVLWLLTCVNASCGGCLTTHYGGAGPKPLMFGNRLKTVPLVPKSHTSRKQEKSSDVGRATAQKGVSRTWNLHPLTPRGCSEVCTPQNNGG